MLQRIVLLIVGLLFPFMAQAEILLTDPHTIRVEDNTSNPPSGGLIPPDMDGSLLARGCSYKMSMQPMGSAAYTGSHILMACDTQDHSGSFFRIWNNNDGNLPKSMFDFRRDGVFYSNAISVQQTQTFNQPVFYTPKPFQYGTDASGVGHAAINATSDVVDVKFPVLGIWGNVSQYGASITPLIRAFGATTYNVGGGYTEGTQRLHLTNDGILALGAMTTFTNLTGGEQALANNKRVTWSLFDGTFSTVAGIKLESNNNIEYRTPFDSSLHTYSWATGSNRLNLQYQNGGAGIFFFQESSADHSAPAANSAVIFIKDNGAGKTQLAVRFSSGATQVLATEP